MTETTVAVIRKSDGKFLFWGSTNSSKCISLLSDTNNEAVSQPPPMPMTGYSWNGQEWVNS